MQTAEQFFNEYLRERIIEEKREQIAREPFRRKYFLVRDSRNKKLECLESERIVSTWSSDSQAKVITTRENPYSKHPRSKISKLRYNLQLIKNHWLIESFNLPCPSCDGEPGLEHCYFCHGTGWTILKRDSSKGDSPIPPSRLDF